MFRLSKSCIKNVVLNKANDLILILLLFLLSFCYIHIGNVSDLPRTDFISLSWLLINIPSTSDCPTCKSRDGIWCSYLNLRISHWFALPFAARFLLFCIWATPWKLFAFGLVVLSCVSACWAWLTRKLITTQLPPHNKLINKLIQCDCLRLSCWLQSMLKRHAHRFHLDELFESKLLAREPAKMANHH